MDDYDEHEPDEFRRVIRNLRLAGTRYVPPTELPEVASVDLSHLPTLGMGESFTVTWTEKLS